MKKIWIFLLIAGIAIAAMSAFQYLNRPGRGDPAPVFTLSSLNSKEVGLEGFRGRPVIVHFFATWCGMCRDEFPLLVKLQKDFESQDIAILAISEDESVNYASVRTFANEMKPSFPILLDSNGAVADSYQSYAVPETIFVDRTGKISWRHTGPINWDSDSIRKKVNGLL